MSSWSHLPAVTAAILACWGASFALDARRHRAAAPAQAAGVALLVAFVAHLTWSLGRPPLRTLGETRLAYALWLSLAGALVATRWSLRWPRVYATALAGAFLLFTAAHPETHDKTLMPALRSAWFVPHVSVYLLAYAFLSAASLAGLRGLLTRDPAQARESLRVADNAVVIGFGFQTLGLCFGALWAKEAWGHYWAWDPKETWALLTWLGYLAHLHLRAYRRDCVRPALAYLAAAWVVLLLCWFGVNYFPSADTSVHTYAR